MRPSEWIRPYIKQHKGLMILTIVLGALGIGSGAMLLFISGYLITKSSLQPENIMIVYVPIVAVRAFSIGKAVFHYVERLVGHDVVLRILEKMRMKLFQVLEPKALTLRSQYKAGDLLAALSDDIEHLQNLYLRTIFPSVIALFIYGVLIAVLGLFDGLFALLMALMFGVIIFLIPFISLKFSRNEQVESKQARNKLYEQLTDAVSGLSDWLASGRSSEFLQEYSLGEGRLLQIERKIKKRKQMRNFLAQFLFGIAIMAMIIWTGIQADSKVIAPTLIAAFVLMTLSLADSFVPVSEAIEEIPMYEESLKRVSSLEKGTYQANEKTKERKEHVAKNINIEMDRVSYRYDGSEKPVIQNVSLLIPAGKKIAILGRSGAGKSTLLKLLSGVIEPTAGTIHLNEEHVPSDSLGKYISVLNQQPHLFDTTVGNNIRIGKPYASDEEIWHVVEQAQLSNLISSLPDQLQTPMHEMGKRFSGGERQRVAFARVLLQQTPVIILDEPTTGLDPVTEYALLDTMLVAAKDKTVIFVTHHLTGMEVMDEIIFLEDGEIVMQGSHEQLMKTNEKYQKLYMMDQGY